MKLLPVALRLLSLLNCRIIAAIYSKSHLTQCIAYYNMYSHIQELALNNAHKCSLKCYQMGEACPRYYFDAHKKLCKLSVLSSASAVRKPIQFFTRNFVHKVSGAASLLFSPPVIKVCVCVSGAQLLATHTTPCVRLCELQPYLE